MKTWTTALTAALLAVLVLLAACGGDDDSDSPTQRPTPTPVIEPTAAGDDDESQVRYTVELFVYRINDNDFDGLCQLYAQSVLDVVPCETIKANLVGSIDVSGGQRATARTPGIHSVEVDGDTAEVDYTLCINIGAGEACTRYVVLLEREDGAWKIAG
ncbi:MAG TPA: nuclear transport factor 2 family protein [Dehalococcoidia bacterium]|nr:nuclear transport factor 2 family protein [Dehalococcoidia bacterium]